MTRSVLFVGDNLAPHMARLAAAVAERGYRVFVWNGAECLRQLPQPSPRLQAAGVGRLRLRGNSRRLVRWLEGRLNARRVGRAIRATGAGLVHFHNLSCHDLPGEYWAGRLPLVATAWGSDVDDTVFAKDPGYAAVRRRLLGGACAVTGDSSRMLDRCRRLAPDRSADVFRLVFWGADTQRFNPNVARRGRLCWRERLGIGPDEWVVLSQRNVRFNYRTELIVAAFARLVRRLPARLLIKYHHSLGDADDAYLQRIRELAAPLGDRVRFLGPLAYDELPGLYAAADAAVSVPLADGAPASFLELMALGVPVVAANLPDYADLIEDGRTGVLVDEPTPETLADALEELFADPARWERIARQAADFVQREGSWERTVERYLEIYQGVV